MLSITHNGARELRKARLFFPTHGPEYSTGEKHTCVAVSVHPAGQACVKSCTNAPQHCRTTHASAIRQDHMCEISTSAREHGFAPASKMRGFDFSQATSPKHVLTALVRNCAFLFRRHFPFQHSIGLTHCKDRTVKCTTVPYVTADGHGPELHTY